MLASTHEQQSNVDFPRNQVTAAGVVRCRFDMMIRWPPHTIRATSNPFTERGDRFEKTDVAKMLKYLLSYFIKKHVKDRWLLVELYDNSRPLSDPERLVLKYKNGHVEENRLINYQLMFQETHFRLPDWLM